MPFARVNDLNFYYEVCGGEPGRERGGPAGAVLCLHGLGSSAADWALQVPVFAAQYRVITVDLRGHGRSQDGGLRYTIAQLADDVAALLAQLKEPPAHVVGLSLGGCVAQALALRYPERVRSLVLVNTFARLQPAGLRGTGRLMRRVWLFVAAPMPKVAEYVAAGLFPKPEQRAIYAEAVARLSRNQKRPYLASMRAIVGFDVRSQLGQLRCPTLVISGDRDRTVPRAAIEALSRGIPGAKFVLIEDSGHATPYDQPQAFNRVVMGFVEGVA
jgi:pimeloyl-ACP methyl ester carboxylesterase